MQFEKSVTQSRRERLGVIFADLLTTVALQEKLN